MNGYTNELCEYNPYHATPHNSDNIEWIKSCSQCVSSSQNVGKLCYVNSIFFKTGCRCDSYRNINCECTRLLNITGQTVYIILPLLIFLMILIWKCCGKITSCRWYKQINVK